MRSPSLAQTSIIALAAALALGAGSARAVQLAISEPADITMFEANGALVPIDFQLVNTGTPDLKTLEFVSITQVVTPNDSTGDFTREVLKGLEPGSCKSGDLTLSRLSPTETCTITSTFIALDGDPFDSHKVVDSATWIAGLSVTWRFVGETVTHNDVNGALVTIKDDPIPEPATWALMLTGFAALGAALRRRRAPPCGAAGGHALAPEYMQKADTANFPVESGVRVSHLRRA